MWDVCRFLITYSALFWSASWPSGASIVTSDHRQRDSPACHPRRETRACNWLAVDHPPPASPLQMAYTAWGNWIASHISCNWPAARARRKINLSSPSGFVLPVRAPDDIRRDAVFWCHVAFYFVSTDSIGPRSSTLVWDPGQAVRMKTDRVMTCEMEFYRNKLPNLPKATSTDALMA